MIIVLLKNPQWVWNRYGMTGISGHITDKQGHYHSVSLDLCGKYDNIQYGRLSAWKMLKNQDETINNFKGFCQLFECIEYHVNNMISCR